MKRKSSEAALNDNGVIRVCLGIIQCTATVSLCAAYRTCMQAALGKSRGDVHKRGTVPGLFWAAEIHCHLDSNLRFYKYYLREGWLADSAVIRSVSACPAMRLSGEVFRSRHVRCDAVMLERTFECM